MEKTRSFLEASGMSLAPNLFVLPPVGTSPVGLEKQRLRFENVVALLQKAPRAKDNLEAIALINTIFEVAESNSYGVGNRPIERMLPIAPMGYKGKLPQYPYVDAYTTKGHLIFIAQNGAFEIWQRDKQFTKEQGFHRVGVLEIAKPGADNAGIAWQRGWSAVINRVKHWLWILGGRN